MGMEERTIVVKKNSVGSFLQGVIIGAAVAMLFAPRSGKETRDMLNEKSTVIRDKATTIAKDTRDRAQVALHDARNKVEGTMKNVKHNIEESASEENKQLKKELEISEDMENPSFPL